MSEQAWAREVATNVVSDILTELSSRSGFDHWWVDMDDDIQEELANTLVDIAASRLAREV